MSMTLAFAHTAQLTLLDTLDQDMVPNTHNRHGQMFTELVLSADKKSNIAVSDRHLLLTVPDIVPCDVIALQPAPNSEMMLIYRKSKMLPTLYEFSGQIVTSHTSLYFSDGNYWKQATQQDYATLGNVSFSTLPLHDKHVFTVDDTVKLRPLPRKGGFALAFERKM